MDTADGRAAETNQRLSPPRIIILSHLCLGLLSSFHMSAKMTAKTSKCASPIFATPAKRQLLSPIQAHPGQLLYPGKWGIVEVRPGSTAQSCGQKKGDGTECIGQPKVTGSL